MNTKEMPMSDALLVASTPSEMSDMQHAMISTVASKLEAAKAEAKSAHDVLETVTKARIARGAAANIHRRATARVTFLSKCLDALRAGFFMMPDMPGQIVAVRHGNSMPSRASRQWRDWQSSVPDERPAGLPAGDGEYWSPVQKLESQRVPDGTDSQGKPRHKVNWRAMELRDPDGLTARFLRPQVMSRTAAAMQQRVFDEIVCIHGDSNDRRRRKRDPIVLGRIVNPITGDVAAFMIAHFIDTAEL